MKNKLLLSLVTVAAVGAATATSVSAAENSGMKTTTDVGIGFKSDDDNAATEGPFKDNLAMVFRPTEFTFGMNNKAGSASTFNNKGKGRQYLVVNDDRKGTDKGQAWTVKAQMTPLKAGSEELANAKLTFGNGAAKLFSYELGTTPDPLKDDYIPNTVNDATDGTQATSLSPLTDPSGYSAGKTTTLEAGGAPIEMLAKEKNDADKTGGVAYQIENVKLNVLDTADLGGKQFTGTINWTLEKTVKP